MIKYSRQREAILKNLQSRRDHPTADMVYESIRAEQPNISLGTVYRNLAFLADSGKVLKVSTGIGPDHFDGFTEPHTHFICRYCGRIIDMEDIPQTNLADGAFSQFDGIIEEYELKVFGKCRECLSK